MYYGYYFDPTYILVILALVITVGAQIWVNGSYSKYKKQSNQCDLKGEEIARRILDANGLHDISVVEVSGTLTDHYDPKKRQVSLFADVYRGSCIVAMEVAGHEGGRAIQDKEGYLFLRIRHTIIPTVNLCSKLGYLVIMLGLLFGYFEMAMVGFILLCAILIFQLVTLPVEFNASKRAMEQLRILNIADDRGNNGTRSMLTAAAMTYVASLASTLLQLLRMLLIILNRRRNNR